MQTYSVEIIVDGGQILFGAYGFKEKVVTVIVENLHRINPDIGSLNIHVKHNRNGDDK